MIVALMLGLKSANIKLYLIYSIVFMVHLVVNATKIFSLTPIAADIIYLIITLAELALFVMGIRKTLEAANNELEYDALDNRVNNNGYRVGGGDRSIQD